MRLVMTLVLVAAIAALSTWLGLPPAFIIGPVIGAGVGACVGLLAGHSSDR